MAGLGIQAGKGMTMLNAIKAAIAKLARKPANKTRHVLEFIPHKKHYRVTYWASHATISYYGENGRKLTSRRVANGDVFRLIKQARACGYGRA
jgi:hypothetical protein